MTEKPRKHKHGDRRDGIWLRDLDPMHGFTPYLYPNRADNEAFIEEAIDLTNMNRYIEEKNAQAPEYRYKYFQIILAAIVKVLTLKPRMNRFIAGNRVYQRTELTAAFVVKKQFNEQSEEALAFLKFSRTARWRASARRSTRRSPPSARRTRPTIPPTAWPCC